LIGQLRIALRVRVNGQDAGGVWTAPYRVAVTPFLKKGSNAIEVQVTNTWLNRILGDRHLPEQERHVTPHTTAWKSDTPLQAAGLIGPVQLVSIN
jgi:hypothetical protein